MKKFLLAIVAATMFTAPTLSVQAAPVVPTVKVQSDVEQAQYRPGQRYDHRKGWDKRQQFKRHHWKRGERMQNWRQYQRVDYRRHKLRTPPRGYQWVRADNDFLLIAIGSGLIASIIAGR